MYRVILAVALIGFVAAADDDVHAEVKAYNNEVKTDGHFNYAFDTSNGISAQESGDVHSVSGGFHYVGKDGVPVDVSYTADEGGYQPHGDLLPTSPPIPEAIVRSLEYNAAHPYKEQEKYNKH